MSGAFTLFSRRDGEGKEGREGKEGKEEKEVLALERRSVKQQTRRSPLPRAPPLRRHVPLPTCLTCASLVHLLCKQTKDAAEASENGEKANARRESKSELSERQRASLCCRDGKIHIRDR